MDSVFCDSVPHDDLSDYRETGIGAGGHWCAGDTTVVSLRLSDSIRAAAGGSGCNRQISAGSADQRRFYHPVYRRAQSVLQNSLGIVDMGGGSLWDHGAVHAYWCAGQQYGRSETKACQDPCAIAWHGTFSAAFAQEKHVDKFSSDCGAVIIDPADGTSFRGTDSSGGL